MDKIYVNHMQFFGYHGVFPEENKLGQRFFVDVILELDIGPASETDDLQFTVNYADVYKVTKDLVEGKPFKLVETLTERISEDLLGHFPIVQAVTVKVTKPDPPIPGNYDSVAVEIKRERTV